MTNYEKMKELVGSTATKEEVKAWAYMNRVTVSILPYEAKEMKPMLNSVNHFMSTKLYSDNVLEEDVLWDKFLAEEFAS